MVFLITGPDTYRARLKLRELKDKFLKEVDPSGLNMRTVNGATLTLEGVRHYLESQPLLARRRLMIFENVLSHKKLEVLEAVFGALEREQERKEGEDNIVIFFEGEEPTTKNHLHAWLVKHAHLLRFALLQGRELEQWVEDEWRGRGRRIDPRAVKRLIVSTGNDLWKLSNEIQKIDAYLEAGVMMDEKAVALMAEEPFDDNIFSFTDAVIGGDLKKSAPMLMEHLARELAPQQLIALLEKQLRVLLLLAEAPASRSAPTLPGIHPYMVKRLWATARRSDIKRLKKIYADLMKVDIDLKSSTGDFKTLLLTFLTKSSLNQS
ncbi:DNA polymerase III subunit delta [Candidatus Uhrbacteria bacterium RIFCSPLOWO2_12_FULL_46_10]|uniref:DNA-directed DNA polymerase n=1 Tax=Candidatus Uhrbacteria bacterium RIFCSPLOWO2_01_FULL_47_25 TaxID=1802402 RepID=A0A1F7UXZ4_9BACT|nr:MAG: polymerase III, delta subunit protein [Parcubacteria group bacterium GW2011_GWA2_46_9]OGL60008.1 MAG: DNA polymerase III subunit delta [Candidatus Uhrbacteria bacterium RIFCSPHIGHO2_01_FULL_46_23]OGL69506.1 MAG: DNA polymerase III subunit delta [Candidatus Uhrbacteria bacterium RIFCSPHIGHO2_02_FULL_47_29]OGL82634.1 MAG: DNA polymerase III subunit delta [Candidatus Uhrbacteria bacterium RIFCSPLOWO2_01_FULL_47_25]OGL86678.1 MAG: DNA polymerase III subunit delta [Candidatus Uhrbacteria bac